MTGPAARRLSFRSMLFVPAHRLELLAKVSRWRPDVVVLDLEDAVASGDKDAARAGVAGADLAREDAAVLVRVNPPGSPWFDEDLVAVRDSGALGVVVPKAEEPDTLGRIRSFLGVRRSSPVVVAGVETAVGVADARQILARSTAAYFGAEDYVADLGGRRTTEGLEVLYARSAVALAGRLAQVPVVDQAVVQFDDDAAFTADARRGRDLGYAGKICIHPRQVALAHEAFTPTTAEVASARQAIDAATSGVGVVDGQMVDAVHVRLAQQVLDRAGHDTSIPKERHR